MFMPWFLGDMIDDRFKYGAVGSWGIYMFGDGLHTSHEQFATGFWDVVTFLVSLGLVFPISIRN